MKTILHFSDLHFSNEDFEQCFEEEYKRFANTIQEKNIKIDYVFLTGDMTVFYSLNESYQLLQVFLDRLKLLLNISKKNIFYISGNHEDISFENSKQNKLFFDFILRNCNKKCLNSCFDHKIEGVNFIFYNSYTNKDLDGWHMSLKYDKNVEISDGDVAVLHANLTHYKNVNVNHKNIICGHKLQEFCCESINNFSKGFKITISSKDGFCSGNYMVGVYTVKKQSDILYAKNLTFTK